MTIELHSLILMNIDPLDDSGESAFFFLFNFAR